MILNKIKELCITNNTTLAALEREIDISNGSIAKWDKCIPRLDTVKKVADYFGITVDELIRDKSKGDA